MAAAAPKAEPMHPFALRRGETKGHHRENRQAKGKEGKHG